MGGWVDGGRQSGNVKRLLVGWTRVSFVLGSNQHQPSALPFCSQTGRKETSITTRKPNAGLAQKHTFEAFCASFSKEETAVRLLCSLRSSWYPWASPKDTCSPMNPAHCNPSSPPRWVKVALNLFPCVVGLRTPSPAR